MNEKYKNIPPKIRRITKYLKDEYLNIIKAYEEEKLYRKSYSIISSNKCDEVQESQINDLISKLFNPLFDTLSPIIDAGIIELENPLNEPALKNNVNNKEVINSLLEEGCERLYIYKYIRYNLCLSFIMQLYLIFEKELICSVKKYIDNSFNSTTLFSTISFIEKDKKQKIDNKIKEQLNLYRNIINVYKHGNGMSYTEIQRNDVNILNEHININNFDSAFVFNLEKINFEELYRTINIFLDEIEK